MKFDQRPRWARLPMPNSAAAALDVGTSPPGPPAPPAPPGPPGPPSPPPSPAPAPAWFEADPDWAEASKDADLAGWVKKANPKSAVALLKSQRELESKLGGAIQPWKDGEDPTQWNGWEKLGAPKDAAGYQIKKPEMPAGMTWDEEGAKAYLEHAAKVRMPQHIAQANLDFFAARQAKEAADLKAAQDAETQNLHATYKEWGVAQDKDGNWLTADNEKVQLAQRAFRAMGMSGELVKEIEGFVGGGRIMKFLADAGQLYREGKLHEGVIGGTVGKDAALARIKELDAVFMKNGAFTKEEKAERNKLYEIAYPAS